MVNITNGRMSVRFRSGRRPTDAGGDFAPPAGGWGAEKLSAPVTSFEINQKFLTDVW
jgi:hypothetical protein